MVFVSNDDVLDWMWDDLSVRLGIPETKAKLLYADLRKRYQEPQRYYHTLDHLAQCFKIWITSSKKFLAELSQDERESSLPHLIELALWYHDVVYDPKAKDNEEQSAKLALDGPGADFSFVFKDYLNKLILSTKHNVIPAEMGAKILVDIDLSILGAEPEVFNVYEVNIRKEYQWVPEAVFKEKRAEILASFLARPTIYQTKTFIDSHETLARHNLTRSLDLLKLV